MRRYDMRYHIITLGCPKNTVDSEGMQGLLDAQGHRAVAAVDEADVIVVNTCSFIASARDETLDVLRTIGAQKRADQRLVAAGCMAQSHADLVRSVAGVDVALGTQEWMRITEVIGTRQSATGQALPLIDLQAGAVAPQPEVPTQPQSYADWRTLPIRRVRHTPSAYLKISDGCNLRCGFCTIPGFKGDMRSKPVGAVLGEAQELAAGGVREIVLVAQHLTDYGRDLGLQDGLALLLDELCQMLPPDVWVRLMYAYPHGISDRLITTMARHPQICHYLDMPLQHAHPDTLRRMRRPPDTERTRHTIAALREAMPDIALRSTFIVGYPGETTAEYRALGDFLAEMQLERVGIFRYSREPGTPAADMPDQVRPHVVERRWHTLMQQQQQISFERNQRWLNQELHVLVEGQGHTEDGRSLLVGRSFRDAPEVDGQVFVWGDAPVGTFVMTRVIQADPYDLWGDLVANQVSKE
jgi:ribosomal protein S12 methylthiotransferase